MFVLEGRFLKLNFEKWDILCWFVLVVQRCCSIRCNATVLTLVSPNLPEEYSILKLFFSKYLFFQYTCNALLLLSNKETANICWNDSFKKALCSISKTTILHVQQNFGTLSLTFCMTTTWNSLMRCFMEDETVRWISLSAALICNLSLVTRDIHPHLA